ncbi:hypothetical protein [Burkholderia sp. Ac-20379]|uniref:hypothetical protein n=1 Tax=Burkholderia sp. Ac-20379 TaxID=2703900 RepID=UPI00197F6E40|nr:hypothetical protein [Burkholderia sp. Ac-20379]MBN3723101.1 hypothetical protein [Burkholderia sp. Ac-20379]
MVPALSPDAIEALKWVDRFGAGHPVPAQFGALVDALQNDGYVYQSRPGRAELTEDGRTALPEEFD